MDCKGQADAAAPPEWKEAYTMTSLLSRRELVRVLGLGASGLVLQSFGCSRQDPPVSRCFSSANATIRWIVPFPPGGGYDIYSRLLTPFYQRRVGAEIAIENTPGAGGIIAANRLKNSNPDGLTLGIVNAPGLLVASLTEETTAPSLSTDLTILGRIVRNQVVWATGADSPLRSMDDVLATAKTRSILFGMSEIASSNFVNMVVGSHLLGIESEFLAGFAGSRETSMAVVRGEVDLSSFTFESILDRIELGDLRPILQISGTQISSHPSLADVPLLWGKDGILEKRTGELNRDIAQAEAEAQSLTSLIEVGLLVAGPAEMSETLRTCLERSLFETLTDPEFQASAANANRMLSIGSAREALADLQAAAQQTHRLLPLVRSAIKRMKG
jgi:tripartite-type tricarboxylate transporter receptor subunit TctC